MKLLKKILSSILFCIFIFIINNSLIFAQKENLNIFDRWIEWSNGENMLPLFLNKQAYSYLDIREDEIAKLETKVDWLQRQIKVKEILMKIVGPFPEKTPLKPRVTGVIQKEGYRIEKIIYESMPNYYVSGCLFIPDGITGKRPAILNVIGHSLESFRREIYQIVIHNLVKKGFIVFAIDPMGQGERIQYTDEEKKMVGLYKQSSTREHSYANNQCFLSGSSAARYWVWDGIRGIDYLLTRSEVDTERIGLTGLSGGGTQTAYIAAFDERVKAAAPAGYICGYRRLLESIGQQDGEQNFYHGISNGIDHADLIEVFAPKPYLIVATTRDFFSIQGARETYREVKNAYKAFGKEENIGITEDDYGHGYTKKNREVLYKFFQEALDLPGVSTDEDLEILEMEELNVTPTGQLSSYLKGETISSINKKETIRLIDKLEESRKNIKEHLNCVRQKAKELSGYAIPYGECEPVFRGRYQRNGYFIEMYALSGEGDYVIPLLLVIPDGGGKYPAMIYIHPEGKSTTASSGGTLEEMVRRGFIVAAADVIGVGETKGTSTYPGRAGYGAVIIGRSIAGIQAGDIVRVVNMLKKRNDVKKDKIGAVTFGELCPALLHAAAFEPSINSIALVGAPVSYRNIISHKLYNYSLTFIWGVAGALTAYDLPDLAGLIAPRKLLMVGIKNQMKEPAPSGLIDRELEFPRSVYSLKNVPGNLKIIDEISPENTDSILKWWLE